MLSRPLFISVAIALTVIAPGQAHADDTCHKRVQEFREWYAKGKYKFTLECTPTPRAALCGLG